MACCHAPVASLVTNLYVLPPLMLPTLPLLFLDPGVPWIFVGSVLWGAALGVLESAVRGGCSAYARGIARYGLRAIRHAVWRRLVCRQFVARRAL